MKILFKYLKPYRWLVLLTLTLSAINIGFSLVDPILFGKMVNLAGDSEQARRATGQGFDWSKFFWAFNHTARNSKPYLEIGVFYIIVGIDFVFVYAAVFINWMIPLAYIIRIVLLTLITNLLSKKIKVIQKNIVGQTTSLAGSTTESLRNIELVKSLGLTDQEVERLNKNTYKILGLEITKVKKIRSISFIQGTFVNTLRQVILFILMWLIFRHVMDAGQMVTMQFFSFFIFGPLQEIGNILLSYREAEASLNNFHNLMQKTPELDPVHPKPLVYIRTLSFKNVSFQHQ